MFVDDFTVVLGIKFPIKGIRSAGCLSSYRNYRAARLFLVNKHFLIMSKHLTKNINMLV